MENIYHAYWNGHVNKAMDIERRERKLNGYIAGKKGWQNFSSWMNGQSSTVISSSAYFLAFYTFSLWWCDENKCDCLSGMERCWDDDGMIECHQQGDSLYHTERCRFPRRNGQFSSDRLAAYWITVFMHFKHVAYLNISSGFEMFMLNLLKK